MIKESERLLIVAKAQRDEQTQHEIFLLNILGRMRETAKLALPVPVITWPSSRDPFDPPTLKS